jgi:hypothetical protein
MSAPTLLEMARQHMRNAEAAVIAEGRVPRHALELRYTLECVLQHLEAREAAMRGPAQTPGEPNSPCEVCGRLTGGCCTTMKRPDMEQLLKASSLGAPDIEAISAHTPKEVVERILARADAIAVEIDLDALQKLCDEATPGPWKMCPKRVYFIAPDGSPVCDVDDFDNYGPIELRGHGAEVSGNRPAGSMDANADFICAARDALPKLIAKVRELQRARVCLLCQEKRTSTHCADCGGELRQDSDGVWYVPMEPDHA